MSVPSLQEFYNAEIVKAAAFDKAKINEFEKKLDNLQEYYRVRNQCIESRKLVISLVLLRDRQTKDTYDIERLLKGLTELMKVDVRNGLEETYHNTGRKVIEILGAWPNVDASSSVPFSTRPSVPFSTLPREPVSTLPSVPFSTLPREFVSALPREPVSARAYTKGITVDVDQGSSVGPIVAGPLRLP